MLIRTQHALHDCLPTVSAFSIRVLLVAGAIALTVAGQASGGQMAATPQGPQAATNGSTSTPGVADGAGVPPPAAPDQRYRIQKGDSLELTFPFAPTFNQAMAVQPDGYIYLRALGDQPAEGLTVNELAEIVRKRYASVLRDPVVTVGLTDFERPYFVAAGSVERPGKYELRGHTSLTQALAVAGGFRDNAKRSHVALFRRAKDGTAVKVREVNVKQLLEGRELQADPMLQAGDLVFVSRSRVPSLSTLANTLSTLGWLAVIVP